ncbi:Aste57867_24353 [Aphanomyces stellatus]|uniref:Aste57867_24353 protein n=1 Tax=Aphanomyces stellatus TaxID=120398 RepID=A0A485LQY5_9STRA|nr:hypothetical protein As57867_024277 [Aphanomyces stellatus]VFU00993.1 Aste57867_24353 [Aphanomyces stellatus]
MATHAHYAITEDMDPRAAGGKYSGTCVGGIVVSCRAAALNAKKRLVRKIQQDSLKQLSLTTQAVLVRSPTEPYYSYHMTITSEYYKQKWIACHRYSDFYRLRKKVLEMLELHAKMNCPCCQTVLQQIKKFDFPGREIFKRTDAEKQVTERLPMLEDFTVALCQFLSSEGLLAHCRNILTVQNKVKEFLQFPLAHEDQHLRAIRSLQYVDPRDVGVDTEGCPICLNDWGELDGNQLVLSLCGHFFHEHCINEWYDPRYTTRFDCPMCRQIAGL